MAKVCTNEKTASRQRWIENGLLELMQERKFEKITVTELCLHLNLSRRSFYRYFRDLEDVLDALLNHTLQDMVISEASLTIRDLEENYRFWLRQKPLLSALARSGMYGKLTEYTLKYAGEKSIQAHLSQRDLEMELGQEVCLFVISGSVSLLVNWHAEGFQKTPEQMAQIAYRMYFEPLLKKR